MILLLLSCLACSDPVRHTSDGLDKIRPVWTPDGRHLSFARALPDGSSYFQVVLEATPDSPATDERRLTDRKETEYHGDFSPDGQRVLLTVIPRSGTQGDCDLAILDASGSGLEKLVGNREGKLSHQEWPSWAPDGQRFAFVSTHDGNQEIYTANPDGSNEVRLTQSPGVDTHPCWTPDGGRIVFATDRFGGLELAIMNADGTGLERLTRSPGVDDYPSVSPDGTRVAFVSHRDGQFEVYVMKVDGADPSNLTQWPGRDTMPAWTRDGRGVTFVSDREGGTDLFTAVVP